MISNEILYIYKITNSINNKIYIGKTENPQKRWREHKTIARGGYLKYPDKYQYLHNAIAKYGEENFIFEVIYECDTQEEVYEAEIIHIIKYNVTDKAYGYNLTSGGEGAYGRICKEETRQKISEAKKHKYLGPNNPFYGKNHTEETKRKIGEKSKGRHNGRPKSLTDEQELELINKYLTNNHYTFNKLAAEYGVSYATIHNIMKRNNIIKHH